MEWRSIPAYDGLYEVSEVGQVRRSVNKRNWKAGRVLAQHLTHDGYPRLTLYKDGKSKMFTVHVLVAAAFLGPRPDGMGTNHKDDNPRNNRYTNLKYGTPKQNSEQMVQHNRQARGERAGNSKLTWKKIRLMRKLHKTYSAYRLAKMFGVTHSCAWNVVTNRTWKGEVDVH